MHTTIPTWSFSTLYEFEKCPQRVMLDKVDKVPRIVDNSPTNPLNRGIRAHAAAEKYIRGETDTLDPILNKLAAPLKELRDRYPEGTVEVEQSWGFDKDWRPVDWMAPDVWGRIKCDVVEHVDVDACNIIDHKTGKSWGNEVKHTQQAQVYAVSTFLRYPKMTHVGVSFWYIDEGKVSPTKVYTRESAVPLIASITQRAVKMTTTTTFPARPNVMNCKYCPFGTTPNIGNHACPYALRT